MLRSNFDEDDEDHDDDLMIESESSEVDEIIKKFYCETTSYMRNMINDKKIEKKLNKIDEISDKIYHYVKEILKMKKQTVRLLKIQLYHIQNFIKSEKKHFKLFLEKDSANKETQKKLNDINKILINFYQI